MARRRRPLYPQLRTESYLPTYFRFRERFRMPARTRVATAKGAGVRKRPGKEPAGSRAAAASQLWGFKPFWRRACSGFLRNRLRLRAGRSAVNRWWPRDRRRSGAGWAARQVRFCTFKRAPPLPAFGRRRRLAIGELEAAFTSIMRCRTRLRPAAFCAACRLPRNAR